MILTDYFRYPQDDTWTYALASGINKGVIRLPDDNFDVTDFNSVKKVYDDLVKFGITPLILEPLPNSIHDHIKLGDELRDESIDKFIKLMEILDRLNIRIVCFNFMAGLGWYRSKADFVERGGVYCTAFNIDEYNGKGALISKEKLWENYEYFLKKVIPYAEKYNIKLALHPDDPPIEDLNGNARIMINYENIRHAIYDVCPSKNLGLTFCQANFYLMGEDVYKMIDKFNDKIIFIHFRNVTGNKYNFHETLHDNGDLDMPKLMAYYYKKGINVPIRVDHVPTYGNEKTKMQGYGAIGRLFAIGYLKGIIETIERVK